MDYNYSKGMETLEDLKSLIESDLGPIVDQAIYHLLEIREQTIRKKEEWKNLAALKDLLCFRCDEIIKKTVIRLLPLKAVNYHISPENITLLYWNKTIEMMEDFLSLLGLFNCKGTVDLTLGNGKMDMVAYLNSEKEGSDFEADFKLKSYKLTRIFFNRKALLTFRVLEHLPEKTGLTPVHFHLDFSHNENNCYTIDLGDVSGITLGISSAFENYIISDDFIQKLGNHHCIEITEKLEVEKHRRIPDRILANRASYSGDKQTTVLHFPFLFRPISLIIPRRGRLLPINKNILPNDLNNERSLWSHSGLSHLSKDNDFHYLDLFSFFGQ